MYAEPIDQRESAEDVGVAELQGSGKKDRE